MSDEQKFEGFEPITGNFTMTPNQAYALMPDLSGAEFKVLFYIVRHTFGFQDKSKRITLDEFVNGRKRTDGTRIDNGTGIARSTVVPTLQSLVAGGYINRETDDADKARVKHVYSLRMRDDTSLKIGQVGSENQTPEVRKSDPGGPKTVPRSEKETKERNYKKEKKIADAENASADGKPSAVETDPKKLRDQGIVAFIQSWKDATGNLNPNAFANKTWRAGAGAMYDAGLTASDVTDYVHDLTTNDEFWGGKSIPFMHVVDNIRAWRKANPDYRATAPDTASDVDQDEDNTPPNPGRQQVEDDDRPLTDEERAEIKARLARSTDDMAAKFAAMQKARVRS